LLAGEGAFLTELRPTVACFVRFGGLDYDGDPDAGAQLDRYIRWVQGVVVRMGGTLIDLTLGDKGSYLYANWGALAAHEDDARRAAAAAQELRDPPPDLAFAGPVQIGLSRGVMRTGAVGSLSRRSYAALGDEVNLTARLMSVAAPGQVLASARVAEATTAAFAWTPLPPVRVKGKREAVAVYALQSAAAADPLRLGEPRAAGALVGRDREIAQIMAGLARARQGQGQVLGLTGEAGIGKSRLVGAAVELAQRGGWLAYGGAGQADSTNTAYLAWRTIWQAFFQLTPDLDPTRQQTRVAETVAALDPALRERVPLLGPVLDLPFPDTPLTAGLDEQLRPESREALLLDLLRGRAQEQPLLLVLEDAHWLDPLSHDLLEAVARAIPAWPVLLLVAYRPPGIARMDAPRVTTLPHFTAIALNALPAAEATQLVAARLARLLPEETPVPEAAVARLVAQAQGNPFYLEELVSYLGEQGVDLADPAALAAVEWPLSLHSLVLSRLDQLAARQQRTLKVASIVGRRFRAAWLAGYYPALGAEGAVRADLEATTRADLTAAEAPDADMAYLFKHIVTQEVAYSSLAEATRRALHEQLAVWLEQAGSSDLDLLAFHYSRSGHAAKRREYLRRAADAAAAAYSNVAAVDYYARLLAELDEADPERGE
jgi:class 3 adenylate cyclase